MADENYQRNDTKKNDTNVTLFESLNGKDEFENGQKLTTTETSCVALGIPGVVLSLLSGSAFSIASLFLLLAGQGGVPNFEILFLGNIAILLEALPGFVCLKHSIFAKDLKDTGLMITAGIGRAAADCFWFVSLSYLPIGSSTAIQLGLAPIFTGILSAIVMKESWGSFEIVVAHVNIAAFMLLERPKILFGELSPEMDDNNPQSTGLMVLGIVMSCLSSIVQSAVTVTVRYLDERVNVFAVVFYQAFIAMIISPIVMNLIGSPVWELDALTAGSLAGSVLAWTMANWAFYYALQIEKAAPVAFLRNINVLVTLILDCIVWKVFPTVLDFMGGSHILVGTVAVAMSACSNRRQQAKS